MKQTNEQVIDCLEKFKQLLIDWEVDPNSPGIRSEINKRAQKIRSYLIKAGTFRTYTISPPPMIGGLIMRNVDPFASIFDPPYGQSNIPMIIDAIEETIGVVENTENFCEDPILGLQFVQKNMISNRVFIVHGHDSELKETVARFLEKLNLKPVVLHEQSNRGRTIIEKFEEFSDVSFAIILMTPDDIGSKAVEPHEFKSRARQNVVFELGYFIGKLGRNNVVAIVKDKIEIPSDFDGILYVGVDNEGAWKMIIAREIKEAGLEIDLNNLV